MLTKELKYIECNPTYSYPKLLYEKLLDVNDARLKTNLLGNFGGVLFRSAIESHALIYKVLFFLLDKKLPLENFARLTEISTDRLNNIFKGAEITMREMIQMLYILDAKYDDIKYKIE